MSDTVEIRFNNDAPPSAGRDEITKRLVVDEMYWDSRVDASKVLVQVNDGIVTLTGHVPTVADRYAAEANARLVDGVVSVENRIVVDRPELIPDPELRENITETLAWVPEVDASDIKVSSADGTVTLRGTVPTYWQKLRAHLLTAKVVGVVRVVDELAVTPTQSVTDRDLARRLAEKLEFWLGEHFRLVQLLVEGGRVTLRGSVPSQEALFTAQETAERTVGVVEVCNELTVPESNQRG